MQMDIQDKCQLSCETQAHKFRAPELFFMQYLFLFAFSRISLSKYIKILLNFGFEEAHVTFCSFTFKTSIFCSPVLSTDGLLGVPPWFSWTVCIRRSVLFPFIIFCQEVQNPRNGQFYVVHNTQWSFKYIEFSNHNLKPIDVRTVVVVNHWLY